MLKENKTQITNKNLFWNFFLIGSYSFGGYMALISIVRKELVEKKKVLTDEQILDGISLASILPGPVAVNAVVYYGFILKGIKGAQLPRVGYEYFSSLLIPKPSVEIQNKLVDEIEKEKGLVNASKQLIEIYEQKIKDRIAKVWGE